jgi:hypothetical protein
MRKDRGVAVASPTTEQKMREILVRFLRTVPIRKRLWVQPGRDVIIFWLETEPISFEAERGLYQANALIYEQIPDARFDFLVFNPAIFADPHVRFNPPFGAEEVAIS